MVRVSLIVPAYNEEKSLSQTLKSLLEQEYPDFELICVNNNSIDKTNSIAKKFTKKVFLEKVKGYPAAVNRGVKESKGEIIAFCDADTIYPKDWLLKVVKRFDEDDKVIAVYGTCKFYDNNFFINFLSRVIFSFFLKFSRLIGFDNAAGFNFIMKKDYYKKVGGYNPSIFNSILMDVELGRRLQSIGKLKQDTSIVVYTSSRRFKKQGVLRTTYSFFSAWIRLNFSLKQKISYEEYNKEFR